MGIRGKYSGLIVSLFERLKTIFLNGPTSKWLLIKACVPQGSVPVPLLFYFSNVTDFPEELTSNAKPFADNTYNTNLSLNEDVLTIHHYLLMRTYPKYCNKEICYLILILQLQEIVFSRKKILLIIVTSTSTICHLKTNTQKHLGLHLDAQLRFSKYINEKIKKRSNVLV